MKIVTVVVSLCCTEEAKMAAHLTTERMASPQLSLTKRPRFSNWNVPGSEDHKYLEGL
jgi:hypothetical protein